MEAKKTTRVRRPDRHTAVEKCEAVLSVWTERRKAGTVCREKGIAWMNFSQWQKRAMEGMLQALGPRRTEETTPSRLSARLEKLLRDRTKMAEKRKIRDEKGLRPKVLELLETTEKKGQDRKEG